MSRTVRPTCRAARLLLLTAGFALAVVALVALSATPTLAAQDQKAPAKASQVAKKPVAAKPAAAGDAGQRAFIDPKTGKLREPEPEEIAATAPKKKALRAMAEPALIQGPAGAVGVAVPEESMSFSVATRNPDGTITTECVTGKQAAEATVKSAKAKKAGARKEHSHDR